MLRQKTFGISHSMVGFRVACTSVVTIVSVRPEIGQAHHIDELRIQFKKPGQETEFYNLKDFYLAHDHKEAVHFIHLRLECAPYSKIMFEGLQKGDKLNLKVDFECMKPSLHGDLYVPILIEN